MDSLYILLLVLVALFVIGWAVLSIVRYRQDVKRTNKKFKEMMDVITAFREDEADFINSLGGEPDQIAEQFDEDGRSVRTFKMWEIDEYE